MVIHAGRYDRGECASVMGQGGRTLELVVAVFHEGLENLAGVRRREGVMLHGTYYQGTVLLMIVAMFDLLSDGSGGFGRAAVGAISGGQNGSDKEIPSGLQTDRCC